MKLNEEILNAWLDLTSSINNERIVSSMPFNELIIYRYLFNNLDKEITATELCNITKMQKSQMNRTLISMEEKNLITRIRSNDDKRKIYVELNKENKDIYTLEHQRIIDLIDKLIDKIGEEKAYQILDNFKLVAKIAKEEL